jgi:Leucine-rich repeat (LRR) protein
MKKLVVFFYLLLTVQLGFSQKVITPQRPIRYPYFGTIEDSVAYASVSKSLSEAFSSKEFSRQRIDSLSNLFGSLQKKMVGQRFYYVASKEFTPWEEVVKENLFDEVKLISFYSGTYTQLPELLITCKNVEAIELVNTRIKKIPKKLAHLTKLKTVLIYDSRTDFKIAKNSLLQTVIVRGGKQQRNFARLKNLEKLDLSSCNLTSLPKKLHKNTDLKNLLLNQNSINLSATKVKNNYSVEKIEMQENKLTVIPDMIAKFPNLKSLVLNGNEIATVSPAIAQLSKLETLSLYKNNLTSIPEGVYSLANLKQIDLYYNQLERVDERISNLQNLEVLYLSNNHLLSIPESVSKLPNLEELYLSNNQLSELPASLASLEKLKVLRINNNLLLQAKDLAKLARLENLDISSNQISELPSGIEQLASLKLLVMVNNPWDETSRENLQTLTKHLRGREIVVQVEEIEE